MSARLDTIFDTSPSMSDHPAVEDSPCPQSCISTPKNDGGKWYPATKDGEIDPCVAIEMPPAAHLIEEEQGQTVRGDSYVEVMKITSNILLEDYVEDRKPSATGYVPDVLDAKAP